MPGRYESDGPSPKQSTRRDSLFRALVENAECNTKAELNRLNETDRGMLLDHVIAQCDTPELDVTDQSRAVKMALLVAQSWFEQREQDLRRAAQRKGPG